MHARELRLQTTVIRALHYIMWLHVKQYFLVENVVKLHHSVGKCVFCTTHIFVEGKSGRSCVFRQAAGRRKGDGGPPLQRKVYAFLHNPHYLVDHGSRNEQRRERGKTDDASWAVTFELAQ
jgi:hypothetical protein